MTIARMVIAAAMAAALAVPAALAGSDQYVPIENKEPRNPPLPPPDDAPELWFPVGEQLTYGIYWGIVPVGEARGWCEWEDYEGRRVLAIRFRTLSNKVLSSLYPVNDYIESLVDPQTFLPIHFVKKMNEGNNHYDQITTFDHAGGTAHWVSKLDNREKTFAIKPDTRDLPSLMYYNRKQKFEPGKNVEFEVMADEKLYELLVIPEKYERVRLAGKRVRSLKIEPKASFGGVFVRKGRLWLWVSDDERSILTQMSASVPVAAVHLRLKDVKGPGDDEWTRWKK